MKRVTSLVAAASAALLAMVVPGSLRPQEGTETVLFFDGVCALCDGAVNFIANHDSKRRVQFAPIQRVPCAVLPLPCARARSHSC